MYQKNDPENMKVVAYDEFTADAHRMPIPLYNNFFMYFIDIDYGKGIPNPRSEGFYQEFKESHTDLEQKLSSAITKAHLIQKKGGVSKWPVIEALHKEMYKAYTVMRASGATNDDLFA